MAELRQMQSDFNTKFTQMENDISSKNTQINDLQSQIVNNAKQIETNVNNISTLTTTVSTTGGYCKVIYFPMNKNAGCSAPYSISGGVWDSMGTEKQGWQTYELCCRVFS